MNRKMRGKGPKPKATALQTMDIPSGEAIQRMRKDRWLSVLELAKKAKVTRQAIAAWESGKRTPRFETARKVWEALQKVQPIKSQSPEQPEPPKE